MHSHNHKGFWGKLLMVLCIVAPIAGIVLLLLNRSGTIAFGGGFLPYLLFLLCPLSHFLMIPLMMGMGRRNHEAHDEYGQHKPCCH